MATMGIVVNIVTYVVGTMHLPSVTASNVATNFGGVSYLCCLRGGILADTFFGRYWTGVIFAIINAPCAMMYVIGFSWFVYCGMAWFSIELRTLVDTGVRLRLARLKIKDDSDVEMLLCDGGHVPVDMFRSGRSLKPKEIMVDMQVEHRLSLLYTKALRAKGLAEQNIFGSPNLSYQLLPAYCHELKRVNHGTVTAIKTDTDKKIEYLFIAFSASLVRYGGVMFIATCQYTNNQVFPLAYGWGDVECKDSWTWFLKELKKTIGFPTNCIIVSDRNPAIMVAMAKKYPEIPHSLCEHEPEEHIQKPCRMQFVR
ncbi:hypothetical protein Ddye_021166 [Dipteronia dyeriana]|uniref:MULE transposase domain-containing protein n=1 Tax=Dipteronia dyeriana TaxID=168575 RepID=A0AAD9U159_9ROSI|nr:hypothetical protein Ddye_021166 [Dipteronia dyeriana]